jgi:hypothetical protein
VIGTFVGGATVTNFVIVVVAPHFEEDAQSPAATTDAPIARLVKTARAAMAKD